MTEYSRSATDRQVSRFSPIVFLAALFTLVSGFVFARFTVDDAYISWRYGKNLVDAGIWGYNPSSFDLTQAYTNPVYAALSIVPAALGLDMVVFFKLVSLAILCLSTWLFMRLSGRAIVMFAAILCLTAVPTTMVHLFSGLETYLFVVTLALLLICLDQRRFLAAGVCVAVLIACRPEAWTLLGLFPAFVVASLLPTPFRDDAAGHWWREKRTLLAVSVLLPILLFAAIMLWHRSYFGYVLPNTFYVKSAGEGSLIVTLYCVVLLVPLALPLLLGRWRATLFAIAFFLPVVVVYSASKLTMNYVDRFGFHIFGSVYLFAAYALARYGKSGESPLTSISLPVWMRTYPRILFAVICVLYAGASVRWNEVMHIATYTPRISFAHGALGQELAEQAAGLESKPTILVGDAGIVAYRSGLVALDNIGLGSALVAHQGVTPEILDAYAPELVALHMHPVLGVWPDYGSDVIQDWMELSGHEEICDMRLSPVAGLRLYLRENGPLDVGRIAAICETSVERNLQWKYDFARDHLSDPPWRYWVE
ncbi:hypothetical protein GQ651_00070 [Alphaproteobacteria bacterium GH1-50]|uniref:Uncharacterized protein n=1 Tax=Kangsaoukella pontilimi TaxID=2691042 RepID=A0A7C9IDY8_9RHOB|nr:hypothetical protein [Kangsaoukella pontilimi]MXQ06229.1 hypothetical protein [Kangsaoukella pontilimi]